MELIGILFLVIILMCADGAPKKPEYWEISDDDKPLW